MKTSDIISLARRQFLYDTAEPPLWDDTFLVQALMEADKEAARRAFLIREISLATAADVATGSSTSTVANQLVDSAATFTAPMAGLTVYNTSKNTWSVISSFTDIHTLVLAADIIVSGDAYIIGTPVQALTKVCVKTGFGLYALSDAVIKIDTCRLASQTHILLKKTEGWLDAHYFNWRYATGIPRYFVEQKGLVQIVPQPDATLNNSTGVDTMILEVFRIPINTLSATDVAKGTATSTVAGKLVDSAATFTSAMVGLTVYNVLKNTWSGITAFTDLHTLVLTADIVVSGDPYVISAAGPEVPARYHFDLIDWICHLAFKKPDGETYNPGKSKFYEESFASKFGRPISALEEENVRAIGGMMKLSRARW